MQKTTKKAKRALPPAAPAKTAAPAAVKPRSVPAPPPPVSVRAAKPAPTKPAPSIALTLSQPDAKSVFVAGSFNQWSQTPLVPDGQGRWVGSLTLPPGRYEYLFVVDGEWLADPNAPEAVENPFGGKNSVVVVAA